MKDVYVICNGRKFDTPDKLLTYLYSINYIRYVTDEDDEYES